jgi:hypothetical protein
LPLTTYPGFPYAIRWYLVDALVTLHDDLYIKVYRHDRMDDSLRDVQFR